VHKIEKVRNHWTGLLLTVFYRPWTLV